MDSTRRSPGRLNEHELAVSDRPYPSSTSMPYLSSKVRMMSSGSDAPPDTATRSADRSRPVMSCWASACSIVGTPADDGAPVALEGVKDGRGANRGTTDRQAPCLTLTLITEDSPKTWKNGSTARTTSSASGAEQPARDRAVHVQLEMGELGALRLAGRAAGVDEHGGVVGGRAAATSPPGSSSGSGAEQLTAARRAVGQ